MLLTVTVDENDDEVEVSSVSSDRIPESTCKKAEILISDIPVELLIQVLLFVTPHHKVLYPSPLHLLYDPLLFQRE